MEIIKNIFNNIFAFKRNQRAAIMFLKLLLTVVFISTVGIGAVRDQVLFYLLVKEL